MEQKGRSLPLIHQRERYYSLLYKQIPIIITLSLVPGLGYILLASLFGIQKPAIIWYSLMVLFSLWGLLLRRQYKQETMSLRRLESWYKTISLYYYGFFLLWVVIFILYVPRHEYKFHYIAIFTEIGTSVVAANLLYSERRLFYPLITISILPLAIYFALTGTVHGYILSFFSATLGWVLIYGARNSHDLLNQTTYQASHDALTGLPNRQFFIRHIQRIMNGLHETEGFSFLVLIDLDHFKNVNDSLGHDVGDELLIQVSKRLLGNTLSKKCLIARLGGDEFIVTGVEFTSREECEIRGYEQAELLVQKLKETYIIRSHHIYISASIGISIMDSSTENANHFIREADIAMYEVKAKGRDGVYLFTREISGKVERHLAIERMLHFAIERKEISVVFQPQFNQQKEIIGAEALVRWNNYRLGQISPVEFISIAEQTGAILDLGKYILRESLLVMLEWEKQGISLQQFSINISKRQLLQRGFVEETMNLLNELSFTETLRKRLIFEITESVIADDIKRIIRIMTEFKKTGIRFSMDDFGTGYSSLGYLKMLPIDEIKIDRQFVSSLSTAQQDMEMLTTILNIASIFHLSVVSEGVETEEQYQYLSKQHCDFFQGFYLSKPLKPEQFVKLALQGNIP